MRGAGASGYAVMTAGDDRTDHGQEEPGDQGGRSLPKERGPDRLRHPRLKKNPSPGELPGQAGLVRRLKELVP